MDKVILVSMIIILILMIGAGVYLYIYPVSITNAYCDNNGHFNFTIGNNWPVAKNLSYHWELCDPKAGQPRHKDFTGNGTVILSALSEMNIVIPISRDKIRRGNGQDIYSNYDQTYYLMKIWVNESDKTVHYYQEQKPRSSWHYDTLPPMANTILCCPIPFAIS